MAQREFPDNRGRVLEAVDIVDVVGDSISLKRKGSEYVGLCPFHDDHKPSMYVVPGKQIFHCFSCGAGGNAIDFVMRHHGLDFREALRALADKAGIELEQVKRSGDSGSKPDSGVTRGQLSDANAMAQSFFRAIFEHAQHGTVARAAAERRGISPEMIERFGIGASPDRFDGLLQTSHKRGVDQRVLLEAGLLKRSEQGKVYDGFRNRLMFPIRDAMGRVIAFGARRLNEEDNPKYLNSPESDLFNKSRALFGLFEATKAIQRERTAIVTEGYTDVVACHQAGVEHAVAALGTAFTKEHARVLKRLCDRVVLLFDGDEAGQRAADRAIEAFFAEPIDVQIVVLPGGADPDDLLKQEGGRERFLESVARGEDALDYRFRRLREKLDTRGAGIGSAARAAAVETEVEQLQELGINRLDPIRNRHVVSKLSRVAGVDEQTIRMMLARPSRRRRGDSDRTEDHSAHTLREPMGPGDEALACLLIEPRLARDFPRETRDLLRAEGYGSSHWAEAKRIVAEALGKDASPPPLHDLLDQLHDGDTRAAISAGVASLDRRLHESGEDALRAWYVGAVQRSSIRSAPERDDASTVVKRARRIDLSNLSISTEPKDPVSGTGSSHGRAD